MPDRLLRPDPNTAPEFGEEVVEAIEFVIRVREEKDEDQAIKRNARNSGVVFLALIVFLWFLFRHDPFGNEAQLVYTTCFGAILGVLFAASVGFKLRGEPIRWYAVIGDGILACVLGMLYGFFTLLAGSLYNADISSLPAAKVDALAIKMGILGVGVGALLGPASKKALDELARIAKLQNHDKSGSSK